MSDRLRIAVFIDFDNIEIGVKNTLGASFDAGLVLEALKERGEVVSKMAYSDWQRAGNYSRLLTNHAIRMVQRNLTPGGDKNGADINLALDALEMAFTHPHINAFVIVGGDSDFISLVEKLKQYDKKVFVVGGQQFTSGIMQRNCHEFIAYENLIGRRGGGGGRTQRSERVDLSQVIPLVKRGLKVLLERDVDPQLGLLKSTLLQLDSTFSERNYGAGTFREFAQKLEKAGVLRVYQGKGGWLVAAAEGVSLDVTPEEAAAAEAAPAPAAAPQSGGGAPRESQPRRSHAEADGLPAGPVARLGDAIEGISELYRIIKAADIKKWPLYLRQVKQLVRSQTPPFDERAYGFASLVDLLRAAHKEGAFRVERDRQGAIRVFDAGAPRPQGGAESSSAETPVDAGEAPQVSETRYAEEAHAVSAEPVQVALVADDASTDSPEPTPPARGSRRRPAKKAAKPAAKSAPPRAKAPVRRKKA
jgi:uncharacterized LabA/DUF88 family protein